MELLQLQYFQTVAKFENITQAAKELHIAQPSLSKTISRLESDLGVPLFDRKGKRITLSIYGNAFLKYVNLILGKLEEAQKELKDLSGRETGSVKIAATNPRVLPTLLGDFLVANPNVQIQQRQSSSIEMNRQLKKGEIDFCISSAKIEGEGIEWLHILDEKIFLSVPRNHRLAHSKHVYLKELKDETFINLPRGYGFRDLTDQLCLQVGYKPLVAFEGEEAGVILNLVEKGLGIAFTPILSLLTEPSNKSIALEIKDINTVRPVGIAWHKDHYFSKAATNLFDFTVNYFSRWKETLKQEGIVEKVNQQSVRGYIDAE